MKKAAKGVLTLIISLSLIFSMSSVGYAYSANGYKSGTLKYGGKSYSYAVYTAGSGKTGAKTGCTTDARISRYHQKVTAVFSTKNDGYITNTSGSTTVTTTGTSYSKVVTCPDSNAVVTGIYSVSGTVTLSADSTINVYVRAN